MTRRKPIRFRDCEYCGGAFAIKNTLARFCSKACRERAWSRAHPGYMVEAQRRYLRNPETLARKRAYMVFYHARPESQKRRRECQRIRYRNNPDPQKAYVRARQKSYLVGHSTQEWRTLIDIYGGRCVYCGRKRPLTKDHIIPISRGDSMAVDRIDNIVPACRQCNSRKRTKSPPIFQQALFRPSDLLSGRVEEALA